MATAETEVTRGRYVGSGQRKLDGDRFLTGRAQYVNDIVLPRMLHASMLRSPHPHARIRSIDAGAARTAPGVHLVITGAEAAEHTDEIPHFIDAAVFGGKHAPVRCLAVDKVRYAGEPVAAVIADTRNDADAALDLIRVDYEVLPMVLDGDAALADGAPKVQDDWDDNLVIQIPFVEGDFEAAKAAADHVLTEEIRTHRYGTVPIETRGYVADWDERRQHWTFHGAVQNPHPLRWVLSKALRVGEEQIRVIAPSVGGGFGLKMHGHPEEPLVCLASRMLGRPVKWIEDRSEMLLIGAREHVHRCEIAFNDDGAFLGLKDHFTANVGAIGAPPGWGMAFLTALAFPLGYKIPATDIVVSVATTNKAPWNAARGYGKEGTNLVMERLVDMVARELGMDPFDVRRRNLIGRDEFPYKTNTGLNIDSGDYDALLDKAIDWLDYPNLRAEQERARADGRYIGIGIAFELTPEAADIPATLVGGYDTTTVRVDPSGRVTVLTGVTTPGGGNDTGIAQIVADELGVDIEDITMVQGDTDLCPYGFGNYSGRSMVVGGSSAALAARDIRAKLATVAAAMLEEKEDDLVFGGGQISVNGNGKSLSVQDVSYAIYTLSFATAHMVEPPLESTRTYKPDNITHFPDEKGRIQPYPTYSNAVHCAVVEVDAETGRVDVQRFGVMHDCGTMINPTFVEGQMQGATCMGIGAALMEHMRYDDDGQLLANRFKTYLMPRAGDVPDIELVHQITPSPFTLLGTKGAGEAGVGGAQAAVANAVDDAIAPFGAVVRATPLSPPAVLRLITEGRAGTGASS